jgi:proline racemase
VSGASALKGNSSSRFIDHSTPGNRGFLLVRPAGRTCLEVKVLYPPDRGKC